VTRLLITGGSGFIGTNLVDAAIRAGFTVLNVDIAPPKKPEHQDVWGKVDILDRDELIRTFETFRPGAVVHLAARADLAERRSMQWYAANVQGVSNVVDAIVTSGSVSRSVFASSRLVFDLGYLPRHERDYHASTLYGQSKAHGEEIVRTSPDTLGIWTIVRPTGIWGPWFGKPYFDLFQAIHRGLYVHPGRRRVRKSYGYVENTVRQLIGLLVAAEAAIHGKTFWLADPPVVVHEWTESIADEMNAPPIRTVPIPALRILGRLGDVIEAAGVGRPPLTSFRVNNMVTDMLFDTSAVESVIGPAAVTTAEGVRRTVAWFLQTGTQAAAKRDGRFSG
jgi:nucleoside-diphosphate-sugar epimerase